MVVEQSLHGQSFYSLKPGYPPLMKRNGGQSSFKIHRQAVVVDRTMYISGQLGMDPSSGQLVTGGVQAEAKQALINMGEILKEAGCDYNNVVKTTVLLADMNDFTNVNDIYKQFFSRSFPARAAYQVAALPRGGLVEIEAVAVLGPITDASS
ncbi:2-iminobutanoate/2-iminopropanoate deaminase-like isoform X2 [Anguilla rostrata]|uniref:2-iminobutanoate/2-iminopropanoate deaminase-like isoform X2 n=1 Tax=Anguilla rostrata TaxID=7938 RepID=UPI0030D282B3